MTLTPDGDRQLPNKMTFPQLLALARQGDAEALGEVIQDCRDYLLLVANRDLDRDLRAKVGASDVVQETLLTAQQAFDQFQGDHRDELLAWLRAILKNDLKGAHRHYKGIKKRHVDRESPLGDSRPDPTDNNVTPSTRAAIDEESDMLNEAMNSLAADHRQVLELRNWQKLSFAEIGQRMNRSDDAARKLWARAIVQLKQALADQDPSD